MGSSDLGSLSDLTPAPRHCTMTVCRLPRRSCRVPCVPVPPIRHRCLPNKTRPRLLWLFSIDGCADSEPSSFSFSSSSPARSWSRFSRIAMRRGGERGHGALSETQTTAAAAAAGSGGWIDSRTIAFSYHPLPPSLPLSSEGSVVVGAVHCFGSL